MTPEALGQRIRAALPTKAQTQHAIDVARVWLVAIRRAVAYAMRVAANRIDVPRFNQIGNTIWQSGPKETEPTAPPVQRWKEEFFVDRDGSIIPD